MKKKNLQPGGARDSKPNFLMKSLIFFRKFLGHKFSGHAKKNSKYQSEYNSQKFWGFEVILNFQYFQLYRILYAYANPTPNRQNFYEMIQHLLRYQKSRHPEKDFRENSFEPTIFINRNIFQFFFYYIFNTIRKIDY